MKHGTSAANSAVASRPCTVIAGLVLAGGVAASSGCTLIGLGIGSVVDSKKPATVQAPVWRIDTIAPGKQVRLELKDGTIARGRFSSLTLRSPEEYAPLYAAARAARPEGRELPELGPGATITPTEGPPMTVELVGVDLPGVVVKTPKVDRLTVRWERLLSLSDAVGRSLDVTTLERLAQQGQLPLLSVVVIDQPSQRVPLDQVAQLELPNKKNGKLTGAGLGLIVDIVVVVALAESFNDSWGSGSSTSSCPFVHSFDGHRFVRDAELYGAATLEAAQQRDRSLLEHLVEADGEYRLLLANELRETDFVDAARLLVVDAPPGARVVPGADGSLLALGESYPPLRALDRRGSVVTAALAASDGHTWVSSPLGRDPGRTADQRDGLVLEFARPPGAQAVTLAFDVRSTEWAAHMLFELLSLQGRELSAWRARMNADAGDRQRFLTALAREGLPVIQVWDGAAWRTGGFLRHLGPALSREQALRVPLDGIEGDTLRVRLDSAAGFWMVDSVVADFSAPPSFEVVALRPSRARALTALPQGAGGDVRALLGAADGRRLVLLPGDTAELAFAAPPERPGCERSFVIEAEGYYSPELPAAGEPQTALFERLLDEPGAFGRFNLERLAADLRLARERALGRQSAGATP